MVGHRSGDHARSFGAGRAGRYRRACGAHRAGYDGRHWFDGLSGAGVRAGTGKANTAILHTGFDGKAGYLETRLVQRGYTLLGEYSAQVGIPIERLGALLVAWDDDQMASLAGIRSKAQDNGTTDV